jgi:opacity protein-like surface antigen
LPAFCVDGYGRKPVCFGQSPGLSAGLSQKNNGVSLVISIKNLVVALLVMISVPAMAAGTQSVTTKTTRTQSIKTSTYQGILSNAYVAGQIGYNNPTGGDLDDEASYSVSLGYHVNPSFRVEGEFAYRENDISVSGVSGDSRVGNLMVNGWYDLVNSSKFTPYVGGGVGIAHGELKGTTGGAFFDDKDYAFVYQAGAGVAYALNDKIDLTADYRFIDTSNFNFGEDYKAHDVRAGLRYNF